MDIEEYRGSDGNLYGLPRGADALPCPCGGYAERVDCTADECSTFGCGRDMPGSECCARAFICRTCKKRISGKAGAPEMD